MEMDMDKDKIPQGFLEEAIKDNEALDTAGEEAEDIDDSFLCCICLDLLYKPVVLACGHVSCFWCVHRTMSGISKSHCPICRFPYYHFPSICQLLHFFLLKKYPVTYKRREKQMLEEEKEGGCFSPQFDDTLSCKELKNQDSLSTLSTNCSLTVTTETCFNEHVGSSTKEQQKLNDSSQDNAITSGETDTVLEGNKCPENNPMGGTCEQVSIGDMLCTACKQLLVRPAVLNCGHVYCETCIPVDEALRCQLCQVLHPRGAPKVCLGLDHFLERKFSKEYALRIEAIQRQPLQSQQGSPSICASQDGKQQGAQPSSSHNHSYLSWLPDCASNVHFGVGCDYCGMFPMVGERYQCKDCFEKIGFDLCGDCYNTRSKLPGRFNQQHKPEHKFELVPAGFVHTLVLAEDGSIVLIHSDDASEEPQPEDGRDAPAFFDDAPEDPEGHTRFRL